MPLLLLLASNLVSPVYALMQHLFRRKRLQKVPIRAFVRHYANTASVWCGKKEQDSDNTANKKDGNDGRVHSKKYTAVVRYDNNVVTIPFVGASPKAMELQKRMTRETHKHHVYLIPTNKPTVASGPYFSLEDAKTALLTDDEE